MCYVIENIVINKILVKKESNTGNFRTVIVPNLFHAL